MTPLWTAAEVAAATGGHATGDWVVTGVSIDTRTLAPGDLFVALTAARDGHDFVAAALARGAGAALVSRIPEGVAPDAPLLVVPDVLAALTALGAAGRVRSAARVVAITGSVGKTSTKEMMRTVFARLGRVHAAQASYNNHWGVPLTLARMPRDTDIAILEIGMNHRGEIAPLARLARPHIGVITTIAGAHLENLGSLEAIAAEKGDLFTGLEPGGIAIIPAGLPTTPILLAAAGAARVVTFGAKGADWAPQTLTPTLHGAVLHAHGAGAPVLVRLAAPGAHVAHNALATLATAAALGADPALAAIDLAAWSPPAGRGLRETITLDPVEETTFTLIDDAYNANPTSVAAALGVLAVTPPAPGARRIAVLGDMLELGATEAADHAALATHPAVASIALIHCAGPRMRALWEALPDHKRGHWAATAPDLAALAPRLARPGDVVLVKGSKGSKVSLVVDALRKLGQGTPPPASGEA